MFFLTPALEELDHTTPAHLLAEAYTLWARELKYLRDMPSLQSQRFANTLVCDLTAIRATAHAAEAAESTFVEALSTWMERYVVNCLQHIDVTTSLEVADGVLEDCIPVYDW
ncbi:uncharacterized protein CcaverHIS019_0601320 [Cutaneotrichosporon cavernicola]|uniref:Uncharacterized protein n=1 Tax=Cutaneotrichosporon cavernicola TaxID=279322 RepID=A0AA48L873_9TREE|nr:uncharacterized protein CcaverHIS019_0601320 [Cutaneotrichosporon cavernicola]BEI93673.1 hypothetical protein CcaverHIS019_0601320 [Cutaneotrichosporon cavernicola]BEJ01450.1 hypothetical protein CcaverHIS631_0601320 [Cutaneotrichosporon cavernicola]